MQILHMASLLVNMPVFELKVVLEGRLLSVYLCSCSLKKPHE